jgi:hypothetical protein
VADAFHVLVDNFVFRKHALLLVSIALLARESSALAAETVVDLAALRVIDASRLENAHAAVEGVGLRIPSVQRVFVETLVCGLRHALVSLICGT